MSEQAQEPKKTKETVKPTNLQYQKDKEAEMVRGIFRFYEVPGGQMEFVYRKFKGPIEKYTMVDGQVYSIPLGVAKHLEKNVSYPIHSYMQDESGKPTQRIGQKVKRCGFQSLEFIDIEDLSSVANSIITVQNL